MDDEDLDPELATKAEPILRRVLADIAATTGPAVSARVRWRSPEEQLRDDAEFARRFNEPGVRHVLLNTDRSGPRVLPLDEYDGYWVLDLSHLVTMIHDPEDVIEVLQDDVIEQLWGLGRSASWPECPAHGGHPLVCTLVDGGLVWRCPQDAAVTAAFGGLADDPRF